MESRDEYYPDKDYSTLLPIEVGIKILNAFEISSSQEAGHGTYAELAPMSVSSRKNEYNNVTSLGVRKST